MRYCYVGSGIAWCYCAARGRWLRHIADPPAGKRSLRGTAPGDAAKHRAARQSGRAGVVEVEQSAEHLTRGERAPNWAVAGVENLRIGRDFESAEREGDTARDRVGLERWILQRDRPVRFRDRETPRAAAILYVRIERLVARDGRVEGL